jgi:hypothetical protein
MYLNQKFEFAMERNRAEMKLSGLDYPFSEHVCKLFLWGSQNEDWKKDWSEEIWNYLKQIKDIRLKPSNKSKFYQDGFFFTYLGSANELNDMLANTARDLVRCHNYPPASFVDSKQAYKSYLLFVDVVLERIQYHELEEEFVLNACNRYLVLNQPY